MNLIPDLHIIYRLIFFIWVEDRSILAYLLFSCFAVSAARCAASKKGLWACKQRKSAFQNTLENFTSMWFVLPMNTGLLGILTRLLPYQFNGLPVLSTIMYMLDFTLSVIICTMTMKIAQRKTAANVDESSFLGTVPIAFLTLTSLTGLVVSNAYWGGHAWSLVAYTM